MLDIEDYLESKGCQVSPGGASNVRTHCFFHGEATDNRSNRGRLYIGTGEGEDNHGLYHCFVCNEKGNVNDIRKHFNDEPIELKLTTGNFDPVLELAAAYYHSKLFETFDAYMYLEDRGISESSMVQHRLGWADGGLGAFLLSKGMMPEQIQETGLVRKDGRDYFQDSVIFPYMLRGNVTQLRGKEYARNYQTGQRSSGKTKGMAGYPTEPYNIDSIAGEDTVYLVEGEIDCLTLQQMGFNAVGVPGVQTFKTEWLDYLDMAKRVFVIFDQDSAGRAGAEKVSSIIGPRSRIVELPRQGIDVNDYAVKMQKNADDFHYLFSKAKGGLLVSVEQAYEQWTQVEGNSNLVGRKLNVPELDRAMTFGILPGQVVTLLARSNAGKTIMTLNLMQRMRMADPDLRVLYFSLEQTRNEWYERAHRIHNFYEPGSSVLDTINYWKNNLMMVDKNRITESQLIDCIDQYAYEAGDPPHMIVIDYLGYYARGFSGQSEKDRVTEAIMGLKAIAKEYGIIVLTPHQANRTGDFGKRLSMDMAKDAATVEETSDLLISLWNQDQAQGEEEVPRERTGIVYQEVLKARDSGVGTFVKYHFAPLTLAMVPAEDPLSDRAIFERTLQAHGFTWREAVDRYLTGSQEL